MEASETIEQMRERLEASLIQDANVSYDAAQVTLDAADRIQHILALNKTHTGTLYIPGTLDIVNATTDKVLRKAEENVFYSVSQGPTDLQAHILNTLMQAQLKYPFTPKRFYFLPVPEASIPGVVRYQVHLHDRDTQERFGMCWIVLRAADSTIVEVTAEPSAFSTNTDLNTAHAELRAITDEQHLLNKAYAEKALPQKEIRERSRIAARQEAIIQRRIIIAETRIYGTLAFVQAALYDGLFSAFMSGTLNELRGKQLEVATHARLRAAKESLPALPVMRPPRPNWPSNDNERHAFFDYFEQHEPEVSDKKIGEYYDKSHPTVRNLRSSLGRKRK